ncbi:MAG: hypothetical protein ACQEXV_14890 [Bacillota bacterium]
MSETMHKGMHESMLITILCSGFGLGFYTPGLLMQAGLRRLGVETAIHIFENVLPESTRLKVDKSRKAYHENFAVALMSQKVPQDMRNSLDLAALEVLLTRWIEEDRRHLICLSGHCMYVLEEYRKRREPGSVHVDIVYMDSTPSPSWKNLAKHNPHFADGCGETTFFENDQNRISHYIDVPAVEHVPFEARQSRLFVHGGSAEILEDMHRRIVELRSQTPRYVEAYVRNTQVRTSSMGLEKGS